MADSRQKEDESRVLPTYRAPPRRALQPVQVEFTELESPSLPARGTREIELREYKRQIQVALYPLFARS